VTGREGVPPLIGRRSSPLHAMASRCLATTLPQPVGGREGAVDPIGAVKLDGTWYLSVSTAACYIRWEKPPSWLTR
jgi:hypothetical protein